MITKVGRIPVLGRIRVRGGTLLNFLVSFAFIYEWTQQTGVDRAIRENYICRDLARIVGVGK